MKKKLKVVCASKGAAHNAKIFVICTNRPKGNSLKVSAESIQPFRRSYGYKIWLRTDKGCLLASFATKNVLPYRHIIQSWHQIVCKESSTVSPPAVNT